MREKSTWRIIPVSKWLITMVSKSPKEVCSPSKWPFHSLEKGVILPLGSPRMILQDTGNIQRRLTKRPIGNLSNFVGRQDFQQLLQNLRFVKVVLFFTDMTYCLCTLPETNSFHLKPPGWKMSFLRGYVKLRGCKLLFHGPLAQKICHVSFFSSESRRYFFK